MQHPLIIAPFFEHFSSAGIVERHFVEELANSQCRPTIVCIEYADKKQVDNPYVEVIAIKESLLVVYVEKVLRNLGLGQLLLTPDYTRYSWNWIASRVIKNLIHKRKFDYVLTISFPCSCHSLGLMVKQKGHIPWLAQFYDPWLNNPIRKIKSKKLKQYDAEGERKVAMNADIILHTNDRIVKDWCQRYGSIVNGKIFTLPIINSHVPSTMDSQNSEMFSIAHIGSLYSGRTAQSFLDALKKVKDLRPELLTKLHVFFVGPNVQADIKKTDDYGLTEVVTWTGLISEEECDRYYESADMFLAIDTSYDFNLFYPSKILKYFSYRKPILALVSGDTVLCDEMKQSRNWYYYLNDIDAISSFLIDLMEGKVYLNAHDMSYWKQYSPERVITIFKSFVNMIC